MSRSFLTNLLHRTPHQASSHLRRFRPMLEALEDRYAPAVLVVTTNADSGVGSLRAEVNTANNGDTINFAAALKYQTITLTTGQITLNKSITIDAQTNNITISGGDSSRIFYNPTVSLTETINNLILTKRLVTNGGQSGAIYDLATLTLTNDTFYYNNASVNCGAVNQRGGTLTVSNGMFNDNQSNSTTGGGALYIDVITGSPSQRHPDRRRVHQQYRFACRRGHHRNDAGKTVGPTHCVLLRLHAQHGVPTARRRDHYQRTAYRDGAQFHRQLRRPVRRRDRIIFTVLAATDSRLMTLNNITFKNNTAGTNGGAVASYVTNYQGTAAVSVMRCLFTNNKATNAGGMGGGLYVNHTTSGTGAASLTVANDTFSQNGAEYAGGIALDNSASNGTTNTVTLTSLTVYENQASTAGGGLWISAATGVPGLRPQPDEQHHRGELR